MSSDTCSSDPPSPVAGRFARPLSVCAESQFVSTRIALRMPAAFLNGEFYDDLSDARLSAIDAGVQHGVGLFETMLGGCVGGAASDDDDAPVWVMHLDDHLERLARSATELSLSNGLRTGPLGDAVIETVRRAGHERARVRVTITGGELSMLASAQAKINTGRDAAATRDATVLIVASAATAYPAPMFESGVSAVIADTKANPFNAHEGHKTLNYWWRLRELQLAASKGAGEGLVFSVTNHLCGGCVSNAIVVKGDDVFTPIARGEEQQAGAPDGGPGASPVSSIGEDEEGRASASGNAGLRLPSAVLPGITRQWAIHELAGEGRVVRKKLVTITDVLEADEIILTNSSWGALPVVKVESRVIGAGAPGAVAKVLRERWEAAIAEAKVGG